MQLQFQDRVITIGKANYNASKEGTKLGKEGNEIQLQEYDLCIFFFKILSQAHDEGQMSCQKNVM